MGEESTDQGSPPPHGTFRLGQQGMITGTRTAPNTSASKRMTLVGR